MQVVRKVILRTHGRGVFCELNEFARFAVERSAAGNTSVHGQDKNGSQRRLSERRLHALIDHLMSS